LLLYTVAQVCRARITGEPIDEATADLIEQTRFGLTPTIGGDLAGLRPNRHCQQAFGEHARAIAERVAAMPVLQAELTEGQQPRGAFEWLVDFESDGDSASPGVGVRARAAGGAAEYQVFTRAYDETRSVATLVRSALLREYRETIDRGVESSGVNARVLARQIGQLFAEPCTDGWVGGQEEGFVDGRRLAQIVSNPNERNVFRTEHSALRTDAIVTFLVDCSGSMNTASDKVAVLVDVFARALDLAGVSCEILGFTTASWNGGRARRDWIRAGRPARPGRLNEVRHLVVKSADTSWRSARTAIAGLLKLDLYREGLDGEAVHWACERLAIRDERRRVLVVISDGSPMDGATG